MPLILLACCFLFVCQLKAQAPDWDVNTAKYQGTMTITGVLRIDGLDSQNPDDLVGIFSGNECRGVASPIYNAPLDRYFVFLAVFGNELPETMSFRVYEAASDSIFSGEAMIDYSLNNTLGSISEPYIFIAGALPFIFIKEDKDGDGFFTDTDCDDEDPFINPGGFEIAGDQIDQNCNGSLVAEIPQRSYLNDFNQVTTDFNYHGFSIRQEEGFDSPALHSNHPYEEQFAIDTSNLYSILNIPIIVDATNPWIRFREVVLVEPADSGAIFPGVGFKDYVIVEARKAAQTNWTPLLAAYDARELDVWSQAYQASIDPVGGISTAKGNQTMFRAQSIDLSTHFSDGDTLKIRFRLYSDYLNYGWGWAIDNLEIQNPTTASRSTKAPEQLGVYPNPFSGRQLQLQLAPFTANRLLHITLSDALGQSLFRQTNTLSPTGSRLSLQLPELPVGCYFLQVSDGQQQYSQKVIKIK